jgi:hypothetical protein
MDPKYFGTKSYSESIEIFELNEAHVDFVDETLLYIELKVTL